MRLAGIRGAITVEKDEPDLVLDAVKLLLKEILLANASLQPDDIASAVFTATQDIKSVFPAKAAREEGWNHVPLMCATEMPVPGSLPLCIRVLIHWNTNLAQPEIRHVYLRKAAMLRPDLVIPTTSKRNSNLSIGKEDEEVTL